MKKQLGFTVVELLIVLLVLVGGTGWIWNIVKIVDCDFGTITNMLVVRVIGVFVAPLGCVLGFL